MARGRGGGGWCFSCGRSLTVPPLPSQSVSKPFVLLALKVYHAPENEKNIGWMWGGGRGGRGEDQKLQPLSLLAPTPSPSVGSPLRRPAFQGREEGLHSERGELGLTAGDPCPAQLAQREEGPPGSRRTGTQASKLLPALSERPRSSRASPSLSHHVAGGGGSWPGPLGSGRLFLSSVSV